VTAPAGIPGGGIPGICLSGICGPGDRGDPVLEAQAHQGMIGGVELHLVDTPAVAVETPQARRVPVGVLAQLEAVLAAERCAQGRELLHRPARAFAFQGIAQDDVLFEEVDVFERRNLIENLMGRQPGHWIAC
jgi:hypothetical protein